MNKLFTLLVLSLFVFGCSKGGEEVVDTNVSIYPSIVSLDNYLSVDTAISIFCKSNWSVENVPDWCLFDKTEGHGDSRVKVIIGENGTEKERQADILINGEKLSISQNWKGIKNGSVIAELMLWGGNCSLNITRHLNGNNIPQPDRGYSMMAYETVASSYDAYFYDKKKEGYTVEKGIKLHSMYDKQYTYFTIKLIYDSPKDGYDKKYVCEQFGKPRQILIPFGSSDTSELPINDLPQNGVLIEELTDRVYKFSFNNYIVYTANSYYTVNGVLQFSVKSL